VPPANCQLTKKEKKEVTGQSKQWFASKTVWGGIAAILSGVSQLTLTFEQRSFSPSEISAAIAAIVGGVATIYGRMKAEHPIAPVRLNKVNVKDGRL
jgi:hypothetical protein